MAKPLEWIREDRMPKLCWEEQSVATWYLPMWNIKARESQTLYLFHHLDWATKLEHTKLHT